MQNEHAQNDINEKLRREAIRKLEPCGLKRISDLTNMSDGERAKWLFWNLHENLDEIRKLEPTLIAQVMGAQFAISDGWSMWTEKIGVEKRLALSCKWHLQLIYAAYQNEETFQIGDGWIDLFVAQKPPTHPAFQENQKGYLDSGNVLHPNQLFLYGWITEELWKEIKPHLYDSSPNCQTELFLRDNFLFPVRAGFDFVAGPPGSIGVTNMEFHVTAQSGERRMSRRSEPVQR